LSAAFRNLDVDAKEDLTLRYEVFCSHYGMTPTRNNPGVSFGKFCDPLYESRQNLPPLRSNRARRREINLRCYFEIPM